MMRALAFAAAGSIAQGRAIALASWRPCARIDPQLVCATGSSLGALACDLLGTPARIDVFDPAAPDGAAWEAICSGASLYTIRGERLDAWLIVRPADARRLIGAAFGEAPAAASGPLSAIECRVLDGLARSLGAGLQPLCGAADAAQAVQPNGRPLGARVYFEVRCGPPIDAALGVALSGEPPVPGATLGPAAIAAVPLVCSAQIEVGSLSAAAAAALRVGSFVRFATKVGHTATLKVGDEAIAVGECGSRDMHAAFLVRDLPSIGVVP